jgi:hypothetical protein
MHPQAHDPRGLRRLLCRQRAAGSARRRCAVAQPSACSRGSGRAAAAQSRGGGVEFAAAAQSCCGGEEPDAGNQTPALRAGRHRHIKQGGSASWRPSLPRKSRN